MKIRKVAEVVNGRIRFTGGADTPGLVAGILTNLESPNDADPESIWKLSIMIGEGPAAREIELDLQAMLSRSWQDTPMFLRPSPVVYFRGRLFLPEHLEFSSLEEEEILLRAKKYVYDEDSELLGLRAAVANLEAAKEFAKGAQRREPLPDDVKLLVWARDHGACVKCGSKKNLHFDHIIPLAKGGGNGEQNIQLLCQICNLRKSDKIVF